MKIALYGEYETRKTLQIGGLISRFGVENVAIISADGGLSTIASKLDEKNVMRVGNLDECRAAYKRVVDGDWSHHNAPGHWVCLDGASRIKQWIANTCFKEAEQVFLDALAGKKIEPRLGRYRACITENDRLDGQKVYGIIGRDSEDFYNAWVRLKCGLYANYLEDLTGTNGRVRCIPWGPDVPGKVGLRALMSSFDYVFRVGFDSARRYYCITANPCEINSGEYLTRRRNDIDGGEIIADVIYDFNLAEFADSIKEKRI